MRIWYFFGVIGIFTIVGFSIYGIYKFSEFIRDMRSTERSVDHLWDQMRRVDNKMDELKVESRVLEDYVMEIKSKMNTINEEDKHD